jgi:protein subunit release factor A
MAMKALIEVRPGEGGEDAKLLVREQSRMYLRYAEKNGLRADIEERGGL